MLSENGGDGFLDLTDITGYGVLVFDRNDSPYINVPIFIDDVKGETNPIPLLPTNLLFNFELGVNPWKGIGTAGSNPDRDVETNAIHVYSGERSLKVSHTQNSNVTFAGVFNDKEIPITNWTSYNSISYWIKANTNTPNTVKIEFLESNNDVWAQKIPTLLSNGYQKVEVGLNKRGFSKIGGDDVMDLSAIRQVNFIVTPNAPFIPSNICYFIDEVELSTNIVDGPVFVNIAVSPLFADFGPLMPTPSSVRFNTTNTFTCAYSTDADSWSIEVSTTNALHEPALTSSGGDRILLKFHQPNFGGGIPPPSYSPPDPNIDANWETETAVYKFVFDPFFDGGGPGSDGFISTFATYNDSPALASTPFGFAVETGGGVVTTYSGDIFFELKVE